MGKRTTLLVSLLTGLSIPGFAQTASDYAIQLNVITQSSPAKIELRWKKLTGTTAYTIDRKGKSESAWTQIGTKTGADSSFSDVNVIADSAYEYRVKNTGGVAAATGYIYAGIRAPAIHGKGGMILMVDTTFTDSCKAEIAQLMRDLRGDGWSVIRHDIGRSQSVSVVRNLIRNDRQAHPEVEGLFLLGHIPVPYSGELNPDGHGDHLGAWPADAFYADVDGNWTDNTVNNTSASRTQNKNIPGDGKWDQTFIPSDLELQCGRVDFANMPAIKRSEVQLMRNYLNKLHIFKINQLPVIRKGLIDDNFGVFSGEAFAANAWRLFPTTVGRANIVAADYISSLRDSAYLWSYGCGGGSYNSAGGIGVTAEFDTSAAKGVFSMLFGSYFGDWDAQNNFLRAPLCAKEPALANFWAGRPNWFMHHMSLGENIGYNTRLSQNNGIGVYEPVGYGVYWIHAALMGDPSLRSEYIKPPQNLTVSPQANTGAMLTWTASTETGIAGYYVYRSDSAWGNYKRISGLVAGTSFNDNSGTNGKKFYLLRPAKLQTTPSGAYYNLGVGIVDSAMVTYPVGILGVEQTTAVVLFPNPAADVLNAFVTAAAASEMQVQWINISGQILHQEKLQIHSGENHFQWNVSTLPSGLYTVMLRSPQGVLAKKWLKTIAQ